MAQFEKDWRIKQRAPVRHDLTCVTSEALVGGAKKTKERPRNRDFQIR